MTSAYLDRPLRSEAQYMEERMSLNDRETVLDAAAHENRTIHNAASLVSNLEASLVISEDISDAIIRMCRAAEDYAPGCDPAACEFIIARLEALNAQVEQISKALEA